MTELTLPSGRIIGLPQEPKYDYVPELVSGTGETKLVKIAQIVIQLPGDTTYMTLGGRDADAALAQLRAAYLTK